jgi:hypothetical protein
MSSVGRNAHTHSPSEKRRRPDRTSLGTVKPVAVSSKINEGEYALTRRGQPIGGNTWLRRT